MVHPCACCSFCLEGGLNEFYPGYRNKPAATPWRFEEDPWSAASLSPLVNHPPSEWPPGETLQQSYYPKGSKSDLAVLAHMAAVCSFVEVVPLCVADPAPL